MAGFVVVLVVTNAYSADTAGLFFTATSLFLLLLAVSTMGTETGLIRFLLRYEAQDRHGDIPPTLYTAFRTTLATSTLTGLAVIVFAEPLADLVGLDDPEAATSLRVLGLMLPFATWNSLAMARHPGVRPDADHRRCGQVRSLHRAAGARPAGRAGRRGPARTDAGLVRALRRRRRHLVEGVPEVPAPGGAPSSTPSRPRAIRELRREFWRFTWPRSITRVSQMAIQRVDIILIAVLRSPMEAAIYTAATRFVALGQFGTQAIQQVVQPRFTALLAKNQTDSLKDVYQISAAWSMAVAWPMYVVVGCAPLAYLAIFGPEYADEGVAVVVLMTLAMLFGVATGPADTLLLMSGRSALSLINSLTALALDIILCVVLIPQMGITGAALAWAVAVSIRCTLSVIQTRVTMGIVSFGPAALAVAAANIVCFAVPLLLLGQLVEVGPITLGTGAHRLCAGLRARALARRDGG